MASNQRDIGEKTCGGIERSIISRYHKHKKIMLHRKVLSKQNHPIVYCCETYTPVLFDALNLTLM